MYLLDKGESWEERHKDRKGEEVKEEGETAGRLGGRDQGRKELIISKSTDLRNCLREGPKKTLTTALILFYFPPTPFSKYSLLGNKTSPILVPFIH